MTPRALRLPAVLLLGLLAACGGGGGGSSSGGQGPQGFKAVGGPSGTTLAGINTSVVLVFTQDVDPDTVSPASINLVTVADSSGQATQPPGILASVTFSVDGPRITLKPTVEFGTEQVSFGFAQDALYEITFAPAGSADQLLSMSGKPLGNPGVSFFFRTPEKAQDPQVGFPVARAFFVDGTDGVVLPETIEDGPDANGDPVDEALAFFSGVQELITGSPPVPIPGAPVRDIVIAFDEGVIPATVFNAIDSSSPSIRVLINTVPLPDFSPVIAPAEISFLQQQTDLTLVRWRGTLEALPPAGFLRLEVAAGVQDLACNSKFSTTMDLSPLVRVDLTVSGDVDPNLYELTEPFDSGVQQDPLSSSGAWGGGVLRPVLAGGLGLDGPLVINAQNPTSTLLPVGARLDVDAKTLRLPTVRPADLGERVPRRYQFTRITIPQGWTVESLVDVDDDGLADPEVFRVSQAGHPLDGEAAPLQLFATGVVDISGTVRVVATDAVSATLPDSQGDPAFAAYQAQGAPGAVGGGGRGGDGGSVLMLDEGGAIALPLASPETDGNLPFNASDGKLRGVTGRSETLTATTLVDDDVDLSILTDPMLGMGGQSNLFALLQAGRILLQPNVGVGSSLAGNAGTPNQFIDENHPTFVVESVEVSGGSSTITVAQGSMVQASENVGDGVNSFHPIAAADDPYLIGPLAGERGVDPSGLDRGGRGGPPYVVVNEGALGITTTSGGGGGGGGAQVGSKGGDSGPAPDPTMNDRGTTGGIALQEAGGADAGPGAPRGTGMVVNGTEYDLLTQTAGAPLADVDPADLVGARLLPNAPDDGWVFRVLGFDGTTFTLEPLDLVDSEVDLLTGPAGFAGPGLSAGQSTSFLLLPREGLGGSGGGGTGVSVTGTQNISASTLPRLSPGVGGGAGGGSLRLETARQLIVRSTGRLRADGGDGGSFMDNQLQLAGGGGGGGGEVRLGASNFQIFQSARVSSVGGVGGGEAGLGRGGSGGQGWVRFEALFSDPSPASFVTITPNTLAGENVGRLVGEPRSGAQSAYYDLGLINPEVESLQVVYSADIDDDGTPETDLTWTLDADGVDGGVEGLPNPPFRFRFNSTGVGVDGLLDSAGASPTFYEAYDLISGRSGLVYDPTNDGYFYLPGEDAELVRCVEGGCASTLVPAVPGTDAPLDIVSMALDPVANELFLLERGTGRVHVITRQGAFRRTITLPHVVEGAMTYRTSMMGAAEDQLLIAANRAERVLAFPPRDLDAVAPNTTSFSVAEPLEQISVTRDGARVDLEITGMAHDPVNDHLWLLDGSAGRLLEVLLTAGMEGQSNSGSEVDTRFTSGGGPVLLSALAVGPGELRLTRSVEVDSTTLISVDALDLSTVGGDLELADFGSELPEVSRSIADGDTYLRFRLAVDGLFDDPETGTSFRKVSIDEVRVGARNVGF